MTGDRASRDPEIARVEEEIARARQALTSNLVALQRELGRVFDWREWVRQQPLMAVAAAFGIGVLLGSWRMERNNR